MRKIIKNLLLAFVSVSFLNCSKAVHNLSDKDCQDNLYNANFYLNEYYIDGNEESLKLSLSIVDSVFDLCPENRGKLVSLKITLLILFKDYDKGFEFVNTLDKKEFDKPYKRNMYLNTFKALSIEAKGDTIRRNVFFKELANEIKDYVRSNLNFLYKRSSSKISNLELITKKLQFNELQVYKFTKRVNRKLRFMLYS